MYKFFCVLLLLCASFGSHAQPVCNYTLKGQVVDRGNEPIPGALVRLKGTDFQTTTGEDGSFVFGQLCEQAYELVVESMGFETATGQVTIGDELIITLREEVQQLEEIEIRADVVTDEHAHNASSLNERELSKLAGKSLGEALSEVTGVNSLQTGPAIFKPVIHGVHSQRILILNHGIRQEGQQWGAEHAPEIDPFIASSVTVIKDASSIKYGTDAIGGVVVVNPSPLPEEGTAGGSLQSVLQSNGRSATLSGMLEGGIKNHSGWGWRVQGTAKRAGDFHTPDYSLTNSGIKERNFSIASGYHNKRFGIEMYASHFNTTIGILRATAIGSYEDLVAALQRDVPAYTRSFSYDINVPRQEVSHNLIKLNAHLNTSRGSWRIQYGFQNNNRQEYSVRPGSLRNRPTIDLQLNSHTLETEYELMQAENRTLCFGITGMIQDNNNLPGTNRIPFIPNFVNVSGGAFAVMKMALASWVVDLGTRYDFRSSSVRGFDFSNNSYRQTFSFHNASLTLGATHQMSSRSSFSTNLSSAWRPPHVVELFSYGMHLSAASNEYGLLLDEETNRVRDIDDVNFKVEQAVKWVNTYRREWSKFSIEATGYANYIFNYIYLRPWGVTTMVNNVLPALRYTQTDALFIGADLASEFQVSKNLSGTAKATLLRASDESNNDYLIYMPGNKYEIGLRHSSVVGRQGIKYYSEAKATYHQRQDRAPRAVDIQTLVDENDAGDARLRNFDFMAAPRGYFLLNLSSGVEIPMGARRLDLRMAAENLLNNAYREYTNRLRYFADDLGRNFVLSAKFIF